MGHLGRGGVSLPACCDLELSLLRIGRISGCFEMKEVSEKGKSLLSFCEKVFKLSGWGLK